MEGKEVESAKNLSIPRPKRAQTPFLPHRKDLAA
jgi:hypothetical protein